MIHLSHLKKYYGKLKAVDDISIEIKKGKIIGLLGPNGAGKSSLLRMITGITLPDSGEIRFEDAAFNPPLHSQHIGYMPEERGLYKKMKVGEQTIYLAQLKGMRKEDAIKQMNYWFTKLDMMTWKNKKVEELSKGMSQKLQFIITVIHNPTLLILDEPFSGLDPVNSEIIKKEIYELALNGTSIIFSTHRMEQVEEICDEIALINNGKIILDGNVLEIKQQYKENKFQITVDKPLTYIDTAPIIKNKLYHYTAYIRNTIEQNTLLQHCIDHQIVVSEYKEILPTLNEIFITLIKESGAVRQFNS